MIRSNLSPWGSAWDSSGQHEKMYLDSKPYEAVAEAYYDAICRFAVCYKVLSVASTSRS